MYHTINKMVFTSEIDFWPAFREKAPLCDVLRSHLLRMYWIYFQNSAKLMKICEIVLFNLADVLQKF